MTELLIRGARVLTLGGSAGPRRGRALSDLRALDDTDVRVQRGMIEAVGRGLDAGGAEVVEAAGRVLMPAFVDAHTHLCWAGDRLDEWEAKLAGASYRDLLARGGGILSTVRAVRAADEASLAARLRRRLDLALREGTGSIEIKSGYGLTTESELKMLRAIEAAGRDHPVTVVPTACIGHAIDPDVPDFVERTIAETLPAMTAAKPGVAIDAYCESGAWTVAETARLLEAAAAAGHPLRVHADQFTSVGMVEEAVRLGALSVDHLEASSAATLDRLAGSETFAVLLPCSGFHLDGRYADGRRLVEAGAKVVVATNANPGSAPCWSVPMAVALAVRWLGLTAAEAIAASTVNAAALLGLGDRGRIAPGLRADLVLLSHADERELGRSFGSRQVDRVFIGGVAAG